MEFSDDMHDFFFLCSPSSSLTDVHRSRRPEVLQLWTCAGLCQKRLSAVYEADVIISSFSELSIA